MGWMMRTHLAVFALLFTAVATIARADPTTLQPVAAATLSVVQNPHTRVELIARSLSPAPGLPLAAGIRLTPQPGWHTYWSNPGDAGSPPRATWSLAGGPVSASSLRFPVPGTLLVSGLMNYVYEGPSTLLADVRMPTGQRAGTAIPLRLSLQYLVCSHDLCVPEAATLQLPLTVGTGALDVSKLGTFAGARAALPKPVDWRATYSVRGGRLTLSVPFADAGNVRSAYFFPLTDGSIDYAAPQVLSALADAIQLETKATGAPQRAIAGVLKVSRAGAAAPLGFTITAVFDAAASSASTAIDTGIGSPARTGLPGQSVKAGGIGWASFLPALLLAVAGGIVLNVMPCVFPILSLKALSLAKGNIAPAAARREALAYTAGIVLVCLGLGGIILGLAVAGTHVGWAFQLQDPRVIVVLLLLTTAIALNLAGLFEITLSSGNAGQALVAKPGAAGSFWTGALAAFVATPCTGPFMAAALGAALVLPPLAGLLVFAGLGFGLALPFLAVGFVPALRRLLPKPGAWMLTFRHILSVPMFATALALAWVLGRQAGVGGMTLGLGAALLTGLALWWFGRGQAAFQRGWLPLGTALATTLAAVTFVPTSAPAATAVDAPAGLTAAAFDAAKLAQLQRAHTPALVYFTADWCLTCKVNERGALSSPAVAAAFSRAGVQVLVGDWTRGDAAIGRFLEAHARAGVPLYLFYHADGRVEELPQILTTGVLIAAAG